MKKKIKNIIKWILVVAVILVIGGFYSFVRKDAVIDTVKGEVCAYSDHDIVYTFQCDKDMLAGIKLFFDSESDKSGVITYVIQDEAGNDVTKPETRKISSLKKDKYTLLKFDRIDDSNGKTYRVAVSCERSVENAVSLTEETQVRYSYIEWDIETMVVFCLGALYLVGLARVLMWIFRK
ncbi:MAG: hypothetical protein ACI4EW_06730 [Butyrivibrio sp.]